MKNNSRYEKRHNSTASKGGDTQQIEVVNNHNTYPSDAIQAKPLEVKVHGNFEKALRAFKSLVQKEKILSSYKERQSFEKPSDKKRRKKNESARKRMELETIKNSKQEKERN